MKPVSQGTLDGDLRDLHAAAVVVGWTKEQIAEAEVAIRAKYATSG